MSDGRGPQLHLYGDRRLSALNRQGPRMSDAFEPRSRLSTIALTPASVRRRSGPTNASQVRNSFGYVGPAVGSATPALLRGSTQTRTILLNNLVVLLRFDNRNTRNRVYMELLLREVYDFCIANNFEADMGHQISLATFEKPTQKDFVFLFKFLYGKLDSLFRFLNLFDADMKAILKNLSYPALDKLRDASSAAGEQNWHFNLAMLYWLVKLNLMLLSIDEEDSFNAPMRPFDKIYNPCVFSSYASFIDRVDDQSEQVMENEFNNFKNEIIRDEQQKRASIEALSKERDLLIKESRSVDEAEDMTGRLKTDIGSLNKYIANLQNGFSSLSSKSIEFDSAIGKLEERIGQIDHDKETYNNMLHDKGIGIEQLKLLEDEQGKINKSIEAVGAKLKTARLKLQATEGSLYDTGQSLHESVSRYNLTIRKIPLLSNTDDLVINEQALDDNTRLYAPESILSRPLSGEKEALMRIDSQLKRERLDYDADYLQILQHIEECKQIITNHEAKLEKLESTLAKHKFAQEQLQLQSALEAQKMDAEIEKMDVDLQAMKSEMKLETQKARTANTNLKRELMETRFVIKDRREHLLRTVQSDLNYVISFKDHIQKKLEQLRAQTQTELESEQRREAA